MDTGQVIITVRLLSFELRFKRINRRIFASLVADLKHSCPRLVWDEKVRCWRGKTADLVATLRFCCRHFTNNQIVVVWDQSSTAYPPRQLRLL